MESLIIRSCGSPPGSPCWPAPPAPSCSSLAPGLPSLLQLGLDHFSPSCLALSKGLVMKSEWICGSMMCLGVVSCGARTGPFCESNGASLLAATTLCSYPLRWWCCGVDIIVSCMYVYAACLLASPRSFDHGSWLRMVWYYPYLIHCFGLPNGFAASL